jgi:PAS domain S-box-containing protein
MACYPDMSGAERSNIAVAQLDAAGCILAPNPAWTLAYGAADLAHPDSVFALAEPAEMGMIRDALAGCLEQQTLTCVSIQCRTTPEDRTLLSFWPVGQDRAIVTAFQMNERDRALGALRQQLSGLMLMTSEAVLTTDRALTITSFNRGAELIFGYEAAELIGRPVEALMPARYRSDHWKHVAKFTGDARQSVIMSERGEIRGLRKDGTEFPAEASIAKSGAGTTTGFTIVLRDVTERRRIESDLHDARWAAEQASMAKSQFLATMSHELRTPLNAIIGFSQVIENRLFGDDLDRYVACASDIRSSGQHLLEMINDILDLSRIESGLETLQLERVNVAKLIDDSMVLVRERARMAGVTLAVTIGPDVPDVRLDRRRMRQVVINLLANAIKFTPSGGRVSVHAGREQDGLALIVSDSGVGIPSQHLAKVFDPFIQVPEHRALNPEGMGLGLSIVRRICETHGGRIDIASTVGKGTSATVWVPLEGPAGMRQSA